jgi:hypothetical protein
MKSLLGVFRVVLVSPEVFVLGLVFLLSWVFPDLGKNLGELLADWKASQMLLLAIPGGTFLRVLMKRKEVLHPPEDNEREMYAWPDYRYYKTHVGVALAWCGLSVLSCFVLMLMKDMDPWRLGTLTGMAIAAAVVSLVSVELASVSLTGILRGER